VSATIRRQSSAVVGEVGEQRVGRDQPAVAEPPAAPRRYEFLDSIRALAAWYVVLHHIWLASFLLFPENVGPWVVGWMKWGYLAVAVFIVVSGFSLALRPAVHDDRMPGGTGTFLRRRAFRILPPYWVALMISAAVMMLYTGARAGVGTDLRSIAVHAALFQDLIGSNPPNGAFWSIAIEWQIYFVFPVLIWMARRIGPWRMLAITTSLVIAAQVLGQNVTGAHKILDLTPQFLALFAMGLVAGRAAALNRDPARRPKLVAALLAVGVIGFLAVLAFAAPAWVVGQYFGIGLAAGAIIAWALFAIARGDFPRVRSVLEHRPLPFLGSFSYSTYLLHIPVLAMVQYGIVDNLASSAVMRFVLLLAIGLPAVFFVTYGFHLLFERPFIRNRSLGAVMRSVRRSPTEPATEMAPASLGERSPMAAK
jgi:peptidoglycan/LPS O-acetylase OafA/YrhL